MRPLGSTGLQVSEVGLGGVWFASLADAAKHAAVIRAAVDAGVNVVDTAPGYKDSEEVVGRALEEGLRSRVILSTKYYPYGEEDKVALSGDRMRASLERSLARLRTDHLDILHLHWVHSAEDVLAIASGELGEALHAEKNGGRVRHIAVSEASEMDGAPGAAVRGAKPSTRPPRPHNLHAHATAAAPGASEWGSRTGPGHRREPGRTD